MTRRRIELEEEAKLELRRAREWYAARSAAAAQRFEEEIVQAIDILTDEAETFALTRATPVESSFRRFRTAWFSR